MQIEINNVKITLTAEQIEEICKANLPKFWEPQHGEEAWHIINETPEMSKDWDRAYDFHIVNQGNVFKTEQEALAEIKLREATYKLKKRVFELNDGKPIIFDYSTYNHCIALLEGNFSYGGWKITKFHPNWFYLRSEKLCQQLIEDMPEELMLYLNQ